MLKKEIKMKQILILTMMVFSISSFAQSKQKIIYEYKKYEKFDFEDLVIEGEIGSPGDLSITPRYQKKFNNQLPYRKNFNAEIKNAVERIR